MRMKTREPAFRFSPRASPEISMSRPVILAVVPGDCPADFRISQLRFAKSSLRFEDLARLRAQEE